MIMKPEVAEVSEDLNLPAPADPGILDVFAGVTKGQDLGVSVFSDRGSEGLRTLLGWPQDQDSPFLLPFRHADGHTEFDKGHEALFQHLDPSALDPPHPFTAQHLQWHQLLGIASAVHQVFSSSGQVSECGILLADEVGLGKTAQGLGLIAFLAQMVVVRKNGGSDPPILGILPCCLYIMTIGS
jgi:SNF2-related domain